MMMTSPRLLRGITPDVMSCLQREEFFTKLESHIFPDGTIDSNRCNHSFAVSTLILSEAGHDEDAREDVFDVMRSQGGFCDCEILLNVAPESTTRAAYWMKKAKNTEE
jgi:hypothetical protein